MSFEMISGVIRHLAGVAGTYLATMGLLPQGSAVEVTTGFALAAGAFIWSILDKKFGWSKPAA